MKVTPPSTAESTGRPETCASEVLPIGETRMEAIGHFAAKVAHDFNNVLTAIVGYGNLLLLKMRPGDPLRNYIEQMLAASERGSQITQSLLIFGRRQVVNMEPVDLNEVTRGAVGKFSNLLAEGIEATLSPWPKPLIVMADRELLEQVIVNVGVNAGDAMPRGGHLSVRTDVQQASPSTGAADEGEGPKTFAAVTVEDTGEGMDQATLQRIFEPLFSTKPKGKGLGLGLAIVYGVIKQHGGLIRVTSEVGKGTCFRIYLPLIEPADPKAAG